MACRARAGDAWRRCHLVSHRLSGASGWREVLMAIRIDEGHVYRSRREPLGCFTFELIDAHLDLLEVLGQIDLVTPGA
jgi:hypothetical protein